MATSELRNKRSSVGWLSPIVLTSWCRLRRGTRNVSSAFRSRRSGFAWSTARATTGGRYWRWLFVALVATAMNAWFVVPWLLGSPPKPPGDDGRHMRLMVLDVRESNEQFEPILELLCGDQPTRHLRRQDGALTFHGHYGCRWTMCSQTRLANEEWAVLGCRTGPNVGSDHLPLIVDVELRTLTPTVHATGRAENEQGGIVRFAVLSTTKH